MSQDNSDDLQHEYDFSKMPEGVRGRYAKEYQKDARLVLLDPDVAEIFPSTKSVNDALRALSKIIQQHEHAA
jgi:hypothetical protein